jgi:LPS-assembly lipoprotein
MSLRLPFVIAAAALALSACGFQLRKEAELPPSMKRVYIASIDPNSPLGKDLRKALPRSGTEIVDHAQEGAATMAITTNAFTTNVLSVSGTARANEYSLRYHVDFEVQDFAGRQVLPKQSIELSRDFTFDASQALGVAAETDLLTTELERDMVQTILRRLQALANASGASSPRNNPAPAQ